MTCKQWMNNYLKPGEETPMIDMLDIGAGIGFKRKKILKKAKNLNYVSFFKPEYEGEKPIEFWYRPLEPIKQ
ncbi:MAG: hypothetical protein ACI4A5_01040 [Hominilimicola sp.]